ncbi:MAG: tyrosine-type recombinase/integrase [Acidobacteria bacterium]|nr:tyrosine-type recombinase/integrase [Acidobacteriota bacterium]
MAEDDIYGSKARYERLKTELVLQAAAPARRRTGRGAVGKYFCRNPRNLRHFKTLFTHFEAKDISFIRRIRALQSMRLICHLIFKDLADCTRGDVDEMMGAVHGIYRSPKSKETFVADTKYIFKILFPERDSQGRPDETIVPHAVRHLSGRSDKSRERLRQDRLTVAEFENVVAYFSGDPRIQAYLTLSLESLARPQELLYVKIDDVELFDEYAKVLISEHGKEGVGLLQCIDSYPYLLKWLDVHPLKNEKDAFLFVNVGDTNRCRQLKPSNINKMIRKACKDLGINKPITCYSLKRNGVTIRRLRGETDMEIQHAARWTSTKQLKTYDMSNQEDAFRRELEKRGLIPSSTSEMPTTKRCAFCNKLAGFGETLCQQCKRQLDRKVILEEQRAKDTEIQQLKQELAALSDRVERIRKLAIPGLMADLVDAGS